MKDTFRLKVVQNLAQQESESAASRLGALNAEAAKAEAKLNMLLQYREEYRERFRSSIHQDVHSAGWKNFQQFLAKLDEAIEQQRAAVLACKQAVHRGQHEWQSKQKQVKLHPAMEAFLQQNIGEKALYAESLVRLKALVGPATEH